MSPAWQPPAETTPTGARSLLQPAVVWALVKQSAQAWVEDRAPSRGAALAYYTLFSLAPLLLIVIAVVSVWFGAEAARGEIFGQLRGLLGEPGALAVQEMLASAAKPGQGLWAGGLSLLLMLVGATTVFAELQGTLDDIWRAPPEKGSGVVAWLRARLLSFGLILGVGFLLLVSLVLGAAMSALERWWSAWFTGWESVAAVVNASASFGLVVLLFAMIYKLMPRVRIAWADVWVGAVVTATLFTFGRWAIGLYVGSAGVASGFGAAGSLVVLMVWVYYSAQIFLLGAEFTWVYAHTLGSRRHRDVAERSLAPGVTPALPEA